ncbi:MAG: NADH:ubiquinone reductase (Na(+)-transporting) subunit A [Woeseia sp.]|nr:NADH:ubiquinone reductase (Na(+)-transporting) subunit A [Woeseia sp.]
MRTAGLIAVAQNMEMRIDIKGGLNLRFEGAPEQTLLGRVVSDTVAVQLQDYRGLQPKLQVASGDRVLVGQPLLQDRGRPELVATAPVAGTVKSINRGARRRLSQIILQADGAESVPFPTFDSRQIDGLGAAKVREALQQSGLWLALRARPFDCVASPAIQPRALFITAIDSNPLAADPAVVIEARREEFIAGVSALAQLPSGNTYVCLAPDTNIPLPQNARVQRAEFGGPHPAGLPGTHLHATGLEVRREPDLWHVGYQDVIAFGSLLLRGQLDGERVIALAGPGVENPGLMQVRLGSALSALPVPHKEMDKQVIAGPLLGLAKKADYLGRFDLQVSVFPAGASVRKSGGIWRNAALRLLATPRTSESLPPVVRPHAGMLPVEVFERVWPYRTSPAALLRAVLIGDPDDAVQLGCLGLAEEDLALCNLVCPSGQDYAGALRRTLERIEQQL